MFINDCYYYLNDKYFIVHEFKIYEVNKTTIDTINFKKINIDDHKYIIKYLKPGTLDLHKWKNNTKIEIIPCNERSFNNHYVMINGFVYNINGNNISLIKSIEKISHINLISSDFAVNYNIDVIENSVLEFMDFVKGTVIDLTNLSVTDNIIVLDKYAISNDSSRFKDVKDKKFVYIPYIVQLMYYRRYDSTDLFDLLIYFLLKCDVKKLVINRDISYIDYVDDVSNINDLVINTYSPSLKKLSLCNQVNVGKKIIVLLHLGNLYQIKYFIKIMSELHFQYTLFVTMNTDINKGCVNEILSGDSYDMLSLFFKKLKVPVRYFETANVGLDMGPFLLMMKFIHDNTIPCDYLLKLHTKSEKRYRDTIIKPIISDHPLNLFKRLETKKLYGFKDIKYDYINHAYVCFFLNKLGLNIFPEQDMLFSKTLYNNILQNIADAKTNKNTEKYTYVPGACFWLDPKVIIKHKLWEFYNYLPEGDVKDTVYQQTPHALKRLICLLYQFN